MKGLPEPAPEDVATAPSPPSPLQRTGELPPPLLIAGRYRIERELGRGGMGRVYVARDLKLERPVAIKLLGRAHGPAAIERFRREARAISGLSHPNIVAIYDAGEEQGEPYLVIELLSGVTLRERLAQGPLPLRLALDVAVQCARGLDAANRKGIVHRDLKPDNLFLTDEGTLKILDFGLAKLLLEEATSDEDELLTRSGQVVGTPGYMAPEQVRGEPITQAADLFMLGIVIYEACSGQRAFRAASAVETAWAILNQEPAPLDPSLPRELREAVLRCLRKLPAERPASAGEIALVLETLLHATPRDPQPALRKRPAVLAAGRKLSPAPLAAALTLVALVALALFLLRPREAPPPAPRLVAVFPFSVTAQPQYAQLGLGLPQLLLDGLNHGAVRAVDAHTAAPPASDAEAGEIARRLHASHWLTGRVVELAGKLNVIAVLHDLAGSSRQARADGRLEQLIPLADALAGQLAQTLGDPPPAEVPGRLPRLARSLTSSEAALAAYLRGEAALRRDDYESAIPQFQEAVKIDESFSLAWYRLAKATALRRPDLALDAIEQTLRHEGRLEPRERSLVDALASFLHGSYAEAERRYREFARAHPDDTEGLIALGETLFHTNPLRGRSQIEAEEWFLRALALDPDDAEAVDHLVDIAQLRGERELAAGYVERSLKLSPADPLHALPLRWVRAWARSDAAERDAVLAELAQPQTSWDAVQHTFVRAVWQGDELADAARIAELSASERFPLRDREDGLELQATVALALGKPLAARKLLEEARRLSRDDPEGSIDLYSTQLAWASTLLPFPPDPRALEALLAQPEPRTARRRIDRLYVRAALLARSGDARGVEELAARLAQERLLEAGSAPQDFARAARARLYFAQARPAAAQRELDAMELQIPRGLVDRYMEIGEPYLRLLLDPAQPAPALAFYDWHAPIWFAPCALLRARALEQAHDARGAAGQYRRYLQLRAGAEPSESAQVAQARERLAALSR